jgi:uncharacterized protein
MTNIELVQNLYRAFRDKDYDAFLQICASDLEWIQNEGFPGGATYHGAAAVVENVFKANANHWENFSYKIEQFLDTGDSVIVIGKYTGQHRLSQKLMQAAAAHIYDVRNSKVCRFRMFADTKTIWDAMS